MAKPKPPIVEVGQVWAINKEERTVTVVVNSPQEAYLDPREARRYAVNAENYPYAVFDSGGYNPIEGMLKNEYATWTFLSGVFFCPRCEEETEYPEEEDYICEKCRYGT